MKKITIDNPLTSINSLVARFSLVLFIVIVSGGLMFSVLLLTKTLNEQPNNINTTSTSTAISVSQSTISTVNNLKSSDQNLNAKTLPTSRINPFAE